MPVRNTRYLPPIPEHILDRHDASVLYPNAGATDAAPTVYRTSSLRIPADLLDGRHRPEIDAGLAGIGLELVAPEPGRGGRHRPVELRASDGQHQSADVDAWRALQQLRRKVSREVADRIGLEHLLFSDNWAGVEGAYTPSGPGGNALADLSSYVRTRGEGGRLPVVLYARKPARNNVALPRRPVVAVLDTGVSGHAWLDVPESADPDGNGFVIVDTEIQRLIAANHGAPDTLKPLTTFREEHIADDLTAGPDNMLCGLGTHWGHGTFIAGIIRQAVPDARVLAVRVMYSDGVAHEDDVLCALEAIEDRVLRAQADSNYRDQMIDVVSLSIGYYPEVSISLASPAVTACIDRLATLGVLVCAAAGNGSTTRPFYPAALADRPVGTAPRVISVGSLNPNRSKALFSNDGEWVLHWAHGAAVVSTFPRSSGSLGPDFRLAAEAPALQPQWRESLDDDDFDSGFALWNGTSFAAPMVAARLARALIEDHGAGLGDVTAGVCRARAADVSGSLSEYVLPE